MLIFQVSVRLFDWGPSACLWWWAPGEAGRVFEVHWRYLTARLGRFELDLQWV